MNDLDKDDRVYLEDILLEIRRIRKFTAGMDKSGFMKDELVCHAVERCIQIIGEAARNVSEKFRHEHPGIEWKKIIAMRNIITHAYGRVDYEVVWEVLQKDITELEKKLQEAAKEKNG